MKMGKILLLGVTLLMFSMLISFVSAEILLSQPEVIYNLGDTLNVEATVEPSQYVSDFFELNLVCNKESKNIHREHLTLDKGEKKAISSSLALTVSFLGNVSGNCSIQAKIGGEEAKSQGFKISGKIDVIINLDTINIEAGQKILLKGSALKENGKKVNGFVEISVLGTDVSITRTVTEGEFEAEFLFPGNAKSGSYTLNAKAYEKSQGQETNTGVSQITLNVKKKASKIEIAVSQQNLLPGNSIIFSPIIYDQANEKAEGEVSVKLSDPFDSIILQKILKSGEEETVFLETNSTPGYWTIEVASADLKAKRLFYVDELERASFEIVNDTLIIRNIGNVVYDKALQISIGQVTEIKNINLDVNGEKKLRLLAPDGQYSVRITDGADEIMVSGVSLVGKVVGIEDLKKGLAISTRYPIVWLFLVAVFGLFIVMLLKKVVKKKFVSRVPEFEEVKEIKKEKGKLRVIPSGRVERAEHALVLHGRKENTGILTINLKSLKEARKKAGEMINEITRKIVDSRGVIYEGEDYIIGIFSSPTTKSFENEIIAVKVAEDIATALKRYNMRSKLKIDYGIGVNSGELIVKKEQDKLKFTTIGNTINLGRKIASLAKDEMLLSEEIQKRVANVVRADKEIREGVNVYHIKSIIDREKNKKFITNFLDRLKEEKAGNK